MRKIRIGSRGSNLALIQSNQIKDMINKAYPAAEVEIVIIKTYGDEVQHLPIEKLNDKGVFIKELERALLIGEVDLAVHSMKDMPSELTRGLIILDPPKSEYPTDVIISKKEIGSLSDLKDSKLGSGSKRRKYQLERLIEGIEVVPIRGNIETRMKKIESENLDGVVLAYAGLSRAGYSDRISFVMDPKEFIPAPCQGILGLQIREVDVELKEILSEFSDVNTTIRYEAEREYQRLMNAGCHSPLGVYAEVKGDEMTIYGCYGASDGSRMAFDSIAGPTEDRLKLAAELANRIRGMLN